MKNTGISTKLPNNTFTNDVSQIKMNLTGLSLSLFSTFEPTRMEIIFSFYNIKNLMKTPLFHAVCMLCVLFLYSLLFAMDVEF